MKKTFSILFLFLVVSVANGCDSKVAPSNSLVTGENLLPRPKDVVSNLQELCDFVDYGVFNHLDYVTVTLENYEIDNLETELAKVYWTAQLVDINPTISGKLFGDQLTVDIEYRPERVLIPASDRDAYVHGHDVSYVPFVSSRDETFSDFAYKDYEVAVALSTSDQLWYCLDQGYRPLPEPGSKAETYLAQSEDILREIVDDTMSDEAKVRAIYDWMSANLTYDFEAATLSTSDEIAALYDAYYLEGVMDNYRGVCDAFAKLLTLLVNMEGIPCKRVLGPSYAEYENPMMGSVGHAWNLVKLENTWYTIDPTGANAIFSNHGFGIASHFYYLTSEQKHLQNYGGGYQRYGYPNIQPVEEFNYYGTTYFDPERTPGPTNDLVMSSVAELTDYLTYAHSLPDEGAYHYLSAEVKVAFSIGYDIEDEIDSAITASGWADTWEGVYRYYEASDRLIMILRCNVELHQQA